MLIWICKAKNSDLDKSKYTGCGIGFDSRSEFLFTDGSYGKNVNIFGADMSSSMHVDNERKGLNSRKDITAEAKYSINFI